MSYIYTLNEKMKEKYGITHMVSNFWFGNYGGFNEYWKDDKKVDVQFTDEEIGELVDNITNYEER